MNKTVLINGRFLSRRLTGVDRFALEVLSAIDELIEGNAPLLESLSFKVLLPPEVLPAHQFRHIPMVNVGRNHGQLWEQWDLPRAVPESALLLNLCNTAPIISMHQIVTIHDAATVKIPMAFDFKFRLWYRILMPLIGRFSRKVITVSDFSKREIASAFGINQEKISVVPNGGEHILRIPSDVSAIQRFGLSSRPYVLAVSSMAAHKNFKLVLEAMSLLDNPPFDVAIAGGANAQVFGNNGILNSDKVKWLGYVSDAELRSLYQSAMCFVFPSLYEGFGIPPLEAMYCGCPVLASSAASIPEVCGDGVLYFDPLEAGQLADLLLRVSGDATLRGELVIKGYERAHRFAWQESARQLLAVCRAAM